MGKVRVTVWNEFRHEKIHEAVKSVYPDGIHETIAGFLKASGDLEVKTATLDEPEHGLADEVLNNTDVLIWWSHMAHLKFPNLIPWYLSVGLKEERCSGADAAIIVEEEKSSISVRVMKHIPHIIILKYRRLLRMQSGGQHL